MMPEDEDEDIIVEMHDNSLDWYPTLNSGISFTLPIFEEPEEMYTPPSQQDLFRYYITSQWLHSSHLADEDPQWQVESWIKSQPHLSEAYYENKIEINHNDSDHVDYYYIGSEQEYCMWRLRWSEIIDEKISKLNA